MYFQIKRKVKPIIIIIFSNLIYLLHHIFNLEFSSIGEDRIGSLAAACDMYLRKKKIIKSKSKIVIFIDNPCNATLLNLFKKKIIFINSTFLKKLINISKHHLINKKLYHVVQENLHSYEEYNNTNPEIYLSTNQKIFGYKQIKLWGITKNDWWVCFHGRDCNYLKKQFPDRNFYYHNYRDFDPNTMIEAMKEVISRGGYVIIMGDKDNVSIEIENDKIIHYNKKHKTDFLDVFLCAEAKFFCGNSSGLKAISQCFNVPISAVNQIGFNVLLQPRNSLLIYKKIFSKDKKRILTFNEMFNLNLFDKKIGSKAYFTKYYDDNRLVPIENTKKEIKSLICDMFDFIDSNKKMPTNLQNEFKKIFYANYIGIENAGNIAPSFLKLNKKLFVDFNTLSKYL